MGCHTWVYKKVSALSECEQKNLVEKQLNRFKNDIIMKMSFEDALKFVESWGEEKPQDYVIEHKNKYGTIIKEIEENGISSLQPLDEDIELIRHKGELYSYIDFDEPLRVFGYPTVKFDNKKNLLKWLKKTKNEFGYFVLDNFMQGYSKELVQRIDDYFSKHGEDNLYIEFG